MTHLLHWPTHSKLFEIVSKSFVTIEFHVHQNSFHLCTRVCCLFFLSLLLFSSDARFTTHAGLKSYQHCNFYSAWEIHRMAIVHAFYWRACGAIDNTFSSRTVSWRFMMLVFSALFFCFDCTCLFVAVCMFIVTFAYPCLHDISATNALFVCCYMWKCNFRVRVSLTFRWRFRARVHGGHAFFHITHAPSIYDFTFDSVCTSSYLFPVLFDFHLFSYDSFNFHAFHLILLYCRRFCCLVRVLSSFLGRFPFIQFFFHSCNIHSRDRYT